MNLEKNHQLRYGCNTEVIFRDVHFRKAVAGIL